jgi:hypothetical protein
MKRSTIGIEKSIKVINKITMSNLKTNNKKNWMLEFTEVEVDEILYMLNVVGKKDNKVNSGKGIVCTVASMYWKEKDDRMIRNIKVRLLGNP